jgi:hypothetical protein
MCQGRNNQNYVFEYFLHMSVLVKVAIGSGLVRCNTLVYVIHLSNVK